MFFHQMMTLDKKIVHIFSAISQNLIPRTWGSMTDLSIEKKIFFQLNQTPF